MSLPEELQKLQDQLDALLRDEVRLGAQRSDLMTSIENLREKRKGLLQEKIIKKRALNRYRWGFVRTSCEYAQVMTIDTNLYPLREYVEDANGYFDINDKIELCLHNHDFYLRADSYEDLFDFLREQEINFDISSLKDGQQALKKALAEIEQIIAYAEKQ